MVSGQPQGGTDGGTREETGVRRRGRLCGEPGDQSTRRKSHAPPPPGFAGQLSDDWQEEFDDPATVEAIAAVLRGLGHEVRVGKVTIQGGYAYVDDVHVAQLATFAKGNGAEMVRARQVVLDFDLRRILLQREPLYGKADLVVDTSEKAPASTVSSIVKQLK